MRTKVLNIPYKPCIAKQKQVVLPPSLFLENKFKLMMSRLTYIRFQHTTTFFTRRNVEIFLAEKLLIDFQITIWPHFHTKAGIWAWASHLHRFNSPCPLQCPQVQMSTFGQWVGLDSIYMTIIQLNTDSILGTMRILVQWIHVLENTGYNREETRAQKQTSGFMLFTLFWNKWRSVRSPHSKQITSWVVPWSSIGLLPALKCNLHDINFKHISGYQIKISELTLKLTS